MSIEDIANLVIIEAPKKSGTYKKRWMKTNKSYPIIHWLISILIAPLLLFVIRGQDVTVDLSFLPYYWLFGFVLSIPVFLIYWISYERLCKKIFSATTLKLTLDGICIIGIFITFTIMNGSLEFVLSTVYSVTVVVVSLFLKIQRKESNISN